MTSNGGVTGWNVHRRTDRASSRSRREGREPTVDERQPRPRVLGVHPRFTPSAVHRMIPDARRVGGGLWHPAARVVRRIDVLDLPGADPMELDDRAGIGAREVRRVRG